MLSSIFSTSASISKPVQATQILDSNYKAMAQFAKIPPGTELNQFGRYLSYALINQEYDLHNDYVIDSFDFVLAKGVEFEFPANVLLRDCTVSGEGTVRFCKGTVTAISGDVVVEAQGESAIAVASVFGSMAIASASGAKSVASVDGTVALASAGGARAVSLGHGSLANATGAGAEAHALKKGAVATATAEGARSFSYEGGQAYSTAGGKAFNDCVTDVPASLAYLDGLPETPGSLSGTYGHHYIGNDDL